MKYVLGIDLGTGSLKGLVFNQDGELLGTASSKYDLYQPEIGYSEQNPEDWHKAMLEVMDELKNSIVDFTENLVGISFSGQMHSLVLLDENNKVVRPAILWNDVRTTAQCREIESEYGNHVLQVTKNVPLEGFTLPKILWVQQNEPENWSRVHHLMLPKDYLVWVLTGKYSMDFSDAAGTLLFDVVNCQWDSDILDSFNISKKILPKLFQSSEIVGNVQRSVGEKFGFKNEVVVAAGGADNACAAFGAGIIKEDLGMISIGTSGVFLSAELNELVDYRGKLHLFNHVAPSLRYSMGVTLSAGNSLDWFKSTFAAHLSFEELLNDLPDVPVGSEGLLFTPYITGERTPHNDSQIRGSFTQMDIRHELKHFTRAVLEGITFSLKDAEQIMKEVSGKEFKQLVSVGGGAKNEIWLQMQADIFNAEIITLESEQGPGVGAAMLAALGSGIVQSVEECRDKFVKYNKKYTPKMDNVTLYEHVYKQYKKVYPAIKQIITE